MDQAERRSGPDDDGSVAEHMKVIIISGFLGSGKTTLLLQLARRMADRSLRVAIIENEIGEIGVDDRYLSLEGLLVQEIHKGCVCCTLQTDLAESITKVETVFRPDCILLEPAGIADPGQVLDTILPRLESREDVCMVTVVDAVRLPMLAQVMTPLVSAQLLAADVVVINKIDEVDEVSLAAVVGLVGDFTEQATTVAVSAATAVDLDQFLDALE